MPRKNLRYMGRPVDQDVAAHRRKALGVLLREWEQQKKTRAQLAAKMPQRSAKAMLSQWLHGHSAMDDTSARDIEKAAGVPAGYLDGPWYDGPVGQASGATVHELAAARDQIIASVVELMEKTDVAGRRACFRAVVLALDEHQRSAASKTSGGVSSA